MYCVAILHHRELVFSRTSLHKRFCVKYFRNSSSWVNVPIPLWLQTVHILNMQQSIKFSGILPVPEPRVDDVKVNKSRFMIYND